MKKNLKKGIIYLLIVTIAAGMFAGCRRKGQTANNEETAFVIATDEFDGNFNPFFATSGNDRDAMGFVNIGLISTDEEGEPVVGDQHPSIAKAMTREYPSQDLFEQNPDDNSPYHSTYSFLLKNDLVFSDGTPLTVKDILFNLYVYLDPVYTGSTTLYSTNIRGLQKYRTQNPNATGAADNIDNVQATASVRANERINNIIAWAQNTASTFPTDSESQLYQDLATVERLFKEELDSYWSMAPAGVEEYAEIGLTEAWMVFLLYAGQLTIDNDTEQLTDTSKAFLQNYAGATDRDTLVNMAFTNKLPRVIGVYRRNIEEILRFWGTANSTFTEFLADETTRWFEEQTNGGANMQVNGVSGIQVQENVTSFDGATVEPSTVIKFVLNGVDPKAIYNFGIPIAPRIHYSTAAAIAAQDQNPGTRFGVEFASLPFMRNVSERKVPIGAGAYKATDASDNPDETTVASNQFFNNNVVYLTRNENFLLGAAKIKKLRYQVVNKSNSQNVIEQVNRGTIMYSELEAVPSSLRAVSSAKDVSSQQSINAGYGYVGINAGKITEIDARRAIITTLNIDLVMDYYSPELASIIHRPMSLTNWAYPQGATTYKSRNGTSYAFDATGDTALELFLDAGYSINTAGHLLDRTGRRLTFTMIIPGSGDHPLQRTLRQSAEILNKIGANVTVRFDARALSALANGELTVWAAAWTSTIDPDMFQVYHMDSRATAVLNWGYPSIINNSSTRNEEFNIITELSELIDAGRRTTNRNLRAPIYSDALDLVMELAVEVPTYQRNNLFIFNSALINAGTMLPANRITAWSSPISELWNISYN